MVLPFTQFAVAACGSNDERTSHSIVVESPVRATSRNSRAIAWSHAPRIAWAGGLLLLMITSISVLGCIRMDPLSVA